ncbi:hypothetical protein QYF36_018796 [Acer negundo]|nr:hypothetical protein QYF36_018796 [Acer negundo]
MPRGSQPNRSTGKSPFSIVYLKSPNFTFDLFEFIGAKSKLATELDQDIRESLQRSNSKYKAAADRHRRQKLFNEGDLLMVHLRKHRFPAGTYSKLKNKKYGPFRIHHKLGDNAYQVNLPAEFNISDTFNVADIFEYHPPDDAPVIIQDSGMNLFQEGEIDAGQLY